jgi:diaminopimelate epimerase
MELNFTKMHGLGNDFILIEDLEDELVLAPEAIAWLCDRNFGIGADGLILIRRGTGDAEYFMAYHNSDGSTAEMCGNGIRCFAKYLVDHKLVAEDVTEIVVGTLGGEKPISVTRDYDGTMHMATVDMGKPILDPVGIPMDVEGEQVFNCPITTDVGVFEVTGVSMGNPHAVIWVEDVDSAPVETAGPAIENHPIFPQKTNVEFAQALEGEARILLRVWERGVGETLACGTGACATLVAATLACIEGRSATVELPGGELDIRWDENEHVYMTGPAREVFTGTVLIPEEEDA